MRHEWFTLGMHLGYRYEGSPICWPDGTARAARRPEDLCADRAARPPRAARVARRRPLDPRSVRARFHAARPGRRCRGRRGAARCRAERRRAHAGRAHRRAARVGAIRAAARAGPARRSRGLARRPRARRSGAADRSRPRRRAGRAMGHRRMQEPQRRDWAGDNEACAFQRRPDRRPPGRHGARRERGDRPRSRRVAAGRHDPAHPELRFAAPQARAGGAISRTSASPT